MGEEGEEWLPRIGDVLIVVGILAAKGAFALWTLQPYAS